MLRSKFLLLSAGVVVVLLPIAAISATRTTWKSASVSASKTSIDPIEISIAEMDAVPSGFVTTLPLASLPSARASAWRLGFISGRFTVPSLAELGADPRYSYCDLRLYAEFDGGLAPDADDWITNASLVLNSDEPMAAGETYFFSRQAVLPGTAANAQLSLVLEGCGDLSETAAFTISGLELRIVNLQ